MNEYTEKPVPPCHPGCERCAKALRVLGPVSYNNWRSWQMYADPPEIHTTEPEAGR